jgi:hypothetical protein
MKHVRVTLDANGDESEIHPMYDLLANASYIETATLIDWNFSREEFAVLQYTEGDIDRFRAAVEEAPIVIDYELTRIGERACYAYIRDETTEPQRELFGLIERSAITVVSPVEYSQSGAASFSVFGPPAEIQVAIDQIPDPIEVTVEQIGSMATAPGLLETELSDRQREAVEAALDAGYYEIPREASQDEVAERIGCAPSTAAEHLRKAETKLIKAILA